MIPRSHAAAAWLPRGTATGGLLLALAASGGCMPSPDPASYITGLRVLTIKAAPPEVAPGQTSMLTALAVDSLSRPINIDWALCLRAPLPGQTTNPDCITNDTADFLQPLGSGLSIMVTMPKVPPQSLGRPDSSFGFYLPVRGRTSAGSDSLTANYRLRMNTGMPPNQNPTLSGIFMVMTGPDGGTSSGDILTPLEPMNPPVVHSGNQITLRAPFTPDSAEMYLIPSLDGDGGTSQPRTVTETLNVSWFATTGTISQATSGIDRPDALLKLDNHLPASGGTVDLYAVGWDERGGIDYVHATLMFQ